MSFALTSFALCLLGLAQSEFADCDATASTEDGRFNTSMLSLVWPTSGGNQFWTEYPTDEPPTSSKGYPVIVFMHALNLGYEWYQPQVERWASHGFVVVFPFIESASADDSVQPIVQETDGLTLRKAMDFVHDLSTGSASPLLKGKIDLDNMALAGHNMGAVEAIRVTAAAPQGRTAYGKINLAVALHPFVCDIGPPPAPYTIKSKEIKDANDNAALLYFTSEDDTAFGPGTAKREHDCFAKNVEGDAIFANFKASACDAYPNCTEIPKTGPYGKKVDCKPKFHALGGKGHLCPTSAPGVSRWTSPQAKWLTTAFRGYLQGGSESVCYKQLWGQISQDSNVASTEMQRKPGAQSTLVV